MTDQEPKQMANSLKEEYLVGSSEEVLKQAKEKAASLGIDVDKLPCIQLINATFVRDIIKK